MDIEQIDKIVTDYLSDDDILKAYGHPKDLPQRQIELHRKTGYGLSICKHYLIHNEFDVDKAFADMKENPPFVGKYAINVKDVKDE